MGTVKSRINRGRTKLQALLKEVYPYKERPAQVPEVEEKSAPAPYTIGQAL
jgi:hypothetical protein